MYVFFFLTLLQTSPSDPLAKALDQFNQANAAAVGRLAEGLEQVERQLAESKDASVSDILRTQTLMALRSDRAKFHDTGRLPEVAGNMLARLQYHQSLYEEQQKLLAAYDEAIAQARKNNVEILPDLFKRREQHKQAMPSGDQVTQNSVWKGYRYNIVLRRFLYELSITQIANKKIAGILRKQNKSECEVEGTLNGPFIEFKITRMLSGTRGAEVSFKGMVIGNRLLLRLEADTEFPMILYLQ